MRHIALFAGICGDTLAAQWAGFETVLFVENDKFCQKIIKKHFPGVPIIGDIKDATKETIANAIRNGEVRDKPEDRERSRVEQNSQEGVMAHTASRQPREQEARNGGQDIGGGSEENNNGSANQESAIVLITGGFPCQPVSGAGKRRGKEDDRWLWPDMLRVISEVRPAWVVAENVAGLIGMGLNDCISDLEGEGYEVQTFQIPACAINAPHRRDRVFIVAHSRSKRWRGRDNGDARGSVRPLQVERPSAGDKQGDVADSPGGRRGQVFSNVPDGLLSKDGSPPESQGGSGDASDTNTNGLQDRIRGDGSWQGQVRTSEGRPIEGHSSSWWAVEPELCRVVDELSKRLDSCGLNHTPYGIMVSALDKEITDATPKNTRRSEALSPMQKTNDQKAVQRGAGGQRGISAQKVLQPAMYGKTPNEEQCSEVSVTQKVNEVAEESVRPMPDNKATRDTPHQWQPNRQYTKQSTNAMLALSQQMALGTREDYAEAFQLVLQSMWGACEEIGHVPKTLSEIPQVWQSLTDQEKDWLIIRCCSGDPFHSEWPGVPRVATGIKNRVDRLKGLGNAIVPQQIYPILKAIADIEAGKKVLE